jgi:putative peptidoglycan lipid II flippase
MSAAGEPRVLRSVSVVSFMTAVSRVLGLVREIVMAFFFGTSALKSAFDIAFIVPNLFRRLFGEGALSSAFVPVFSETLVKEGRDSAYRFAVRVISLLAAVLGAVTLLGILLTWPLERMLPPDSRWLIPLPMLRIMLPYALLICVAALLSGMLNALGRFAIPSLTPFLLNLVWIVTLCAACPLLRGLPEAQIIVLSWAILLAGLAQIVFQLPELAKQGFRFRLVFAGLFADPKLRRVLALMAPAALGIGIIQINVCVDKFLAFWADPAAPAALEYAERVVYLPLGMFGTAFMTVLLPTFSRQAANGDTARMRETLERAIRNLAVIMAPCSAALLALALPVIALIYGIKGGRFDETSAVLSARALAAYAPGLLVFSLQKALTPVFYGLQDLRTPVRVSLVGLTLNVALNVASVLLLPHGWKHVGIAGSTVVTSLVNGVTLAVILRRRAGFLRLSAVAWPVVRAVACAAVMAVAALCAHALCMRAAPLAGLEGKLAELAAMGATVLVGVAVYGALMALVSRGELREMAGEFRARRSRATVDR